MSELKENRGALLRDLLGLLVALTAGVVVFLPFASSTSPLDAVMLNVPENQGNWWHALIGAPFFLAFPMIWVRLRSLASNRTPTPAGQRLIWITASASICGTIAVETPFLLHLAGTSEWQRLVVLSLGLGVAIASGAGLFLRRGRIAPLRQCLVGLSTAYLANAAVCLVVYAKAEGPFASRSGWLITMMIVWPMALEVVWIFSRSVSPKPAPPVAGQGLAAGLRATRK